MRRDEAILLVNPCFLFHHQTALRRGEAIPDEVVVGIIVEAIRKLPDGTGWVLDAFPQTVEQAVLLEKALTGNQFTNQGVQVGRQAGK